MYIIFNKDGSIKESQLNDYINQYSDGVNTIDIAIVGTTFDNYTASVTYTFSNGETATDSGTPINYIKTSSGVYTGWRFTLHSAFTQYSGDLLASFIGITNSTSKTTLFSYPVTLNVNATSSARQVELTWEQFKSLEQAQADYQLQYSTSNVRGYYSALDLPDDSSLAADQLFFATHKDSQMYLGHELYVAYGGGGHSDPLGVGLVGNRPYFVYTQTNSSPADTIQDVGTGLASRLYDANGNIRVSYGSETNDYGFFVNVLDKSANYDGTISLGAKNYKFAYDSAVDVFSSDGNTTAIKSPMGSASVELANGEAMIKANKTTITLPSSSAQISIGGFIVTNIYGTTFYGSNDFDVAPPTCSYTPWNDNQLTNKSYVDKTADSKAAEYANIEQSRAQDVENALQDAIDAINASQNFVATVATYADLANINPNFLEKNVDCVLVLKDENHNYQAYVYKYIGSETGAYDSWFDPVGELGDYYTKAQINEKVNALNASITSAKTECKAYADTEVGKAKDALRYFYLDEEGYLCLDYDKITA